jgi:hypothetical protein
MEAVVHAYGDDWDVALSMAEGEDYDIRYIDNYHPADHRVMGGRLAYRSGMAALVFVKLKSLRHLH